MTKASTRPPAPESDPREDELYEEYLDAVLEGRATPPDTFLAGHPQASDALRRRVVALHESRSRPTVSDAAAVHETGDLPFQRLGEYRVLRRLDQGGMGTVYLGEQESLGRLVALKVLRPELQGSATSVARFVREAQVVARLRHPNVVTPYGVGEERGVRFLAMEYVAGHGLDDLLRDARADGSLLPVATCVRWILQIAGALQAVHEVGVVHRDVKPSNIRITPEGRPVLLDFGIAREDGLERLTLSGPLMGTVVYAAPEQVRLTGRRREVDGRTDVYSLGVVLYELVTGVTPFEGGSTEEILHRMVWDDPTPPRKLRPGISRDLETVLRKAMAKTPGARYDSAAAFADDLDGVLHFRPIQARPPGLVYATWKWAHRRPGLASALATILLACVVVAGWRVQARRATEQAARAEAASLVESAIDRLRDYREVHKAAVDAQKRLTGLGIARESRHMTDEMDREFSRVERIVSAFRREREAVHHEVLEMLRRGERLDRRVIGAGGARAQLYFERWKDATAERDRDAAEFYRDLVVDLDPDGALVEKMAGFGTFVLHCDTPGTTATLFRYREEAQIRPGGDRRMVPVATGDHEPLARPGSWLLRALDSRPPLRRGDLVLRVGDVDVSRHTWRDLRDRLTDDGGRVQVARDGRRVSLDVPPGARLHATAAPVLLPPVGIDALLPETVHRAPAGSYLVVLRAPGHEHQKMWFNIDPGREQELRAELLPEGSTPPGFVHIAHERVEPFWIMDREVTAFEYLEFLNDPHTLARIDGADGAVLFPRSPPTVIDGGHWARDRDGSYRLADDWSPRWPVLGVSFDDATAYAAWKTRRSGGRTRYALPTPLEFIVAGSPSVDRQFVHGETFRPKWVKSCFATEQAGIEDVLTYPVDETVTGVYDMMGSMFEWLDGWFDEGRGLRHLGGGSWARARPETFRISGGIGAEAGHAADEYGFRLVIRGGGSGKEAR